MSDETGERSTDGSTMTEAQALKWIQDMHAAEVADLRAQLAALQATADRYREALREIHDDAVDVFDAERIARRALADTSPPAQPACANCVGAAHLGPCLPWAVEAKRQIDRNHAADIAGTAAQPVALHPATVEACAMEADKMAAEFLERHNAARKRRASRLVIEDLSGRWAAAGDVASAIRSLLSSPRGAR